VQQHDYGLFYQQEIEGRRMFFYPPFARLIMLTIKHKSKDVVDAAARLMAFALQGEFGKYLVGPAEPVVNRVRNQYLMELLIKLPKDGELIQRCKRFVLEQVAILHNDKRFRNVVVIPDVDAM
jgi:primosomal protein N' (replication factor Y)